MDSKKKQIERDAVRSNVRVVIADDESLARQLLVRLVETDESLEIVGVANDGDSARRIVEDTLPDIIFLDIQMPKQSGIEMASTILSRGNKAQVIFVTAHEDHAIRAFDLGALDYLVKPIEKARFFKAVERAKSAIRARRVRQLGDEIAAVASGKEPRVSATGAEEPFIIVKQRDELIQVRERDIYWLEAANQYVHIHTESARYIAAESLKKYFSKLSPVRFARVHRSAVVNISKIAHVRKQQNGVHELQLANGVSVPLSRSRRALVSQILGACAAKNDSLTP